MNAFRLWAAFAATMMLTAYVVSANGPQWARVMWLSLGIWNAFVTLMPYDKD